MQTPKVPRHNAPRMLDMHAHHKGGSHALAAHVAVARKCNCLIHYAILSMKSPVANEAAQTGPAA